MKKAISEELLESVVVNRLFFGMRTEDICEKTGMSKAFVNATIATYKAVGAADWNQVKKMLDGKQMTLKTAEWAAERQGVKLPDIFYAPVTPVVARSQGEQPQELPKQLEGQTKMPECDYKEIRFSNGTNNSIHALIDALNKNTAEMIQLRQAVFALLNTAALVE